MLPVSKAVRLSFLQPSRPPDRRPTLPPRGKRPALAAAGRRGGSWASVVEFARAKGGDPVTARP